MQPSTSYARHHHRYQQMTWHFCEKIIHSNNCTRCLNTPRLSISQRDQKFLHLIVSKHLVCSIFVNTSIIWWCFSNMLLDSITLWGNEMIPGNKPAPRGSLMKKYCFLVDSSGGSNDCAPYSSTSATNSRRCSTSSSMEWCSNHLEGQASRRM